MCRQILSGPPAGPAALRPPKTRPRIQDGPVPPKTRAADWQELRNGSVLRQVLRVRVGRTLIAVAWQNGRSVAAVRRRTALHVRGWGRPCPYSGCGITVVVAAATAAQVSCKGGRTAAPGLPRKTGPHRREPVSRRRRPPDAGRRLRCTTGWGCAGSCVPAVTARRRHGQGGRTPARARHAGIGATDPGSAGRPAGRRRTGGSAEAVTSLQIPQVAIRPTAHRPRALSKHPAASSCLPRERSALPLQKYACAGSRPRSIARSKHPRASSYRDAECSARPLPRWALA